MGIAVHPSTESLESHLEHSILKRRRNEELAMGDLAHLWAHMGDRVGTIFVWSNSGWWNWSSGVTGGVWWTPNPPWEESGFLDCILIRLAWLLVGKMRIEVFAAHQQTPLRAYYEICLGAPSQLKNSSNFRRLTEASAAACLSWLRWSMVATHHQQNNKYESLTACSR